jgi:hypothetical protein
MGKTVGGEKVIVIGYRPEEEACKRAGWIAYKRGKVFKNLMQL